MFIHVQSNRQMYSRHPVAASDRTIRESLDFRDRLKRIRIVSVICYAQEAKLQEPSYQYVRRIPSLCIASAACFIGKVLYNQWLNLAVGDPGPHFFLDRAHQPRLVWLGSVAESRTGEDEPFTHHKPQIDIRRTVRPVPRCSHDGSSGREYREVARNVIAADHIEHYIDAALFGFAVR